MFWAGGMGFRAVGLGFSHLVVSTQGNHQAKGRDFYAAMRQFAVA